MLLGILLLALTTPATSQEADGALGGLDRATVERVIANVSEGRWPHMFHLGGLGAGFDVTTPYMKIAIASATAQGRNRTFTADNVTSEMLTFDVYVTPPPKSSDEAIRQFVEYEANHESHGLLSHCVIAPTHTEVLNVVDAVVTGPHGTELDEVSLAETKPLDVRVADAGARAPDSAGRYGTGLIVTIPLEAVRQRANLRVLFSNGSHDDLKLEPEWLRSP